MICPCIKTNCDGYKEERITYPSTLMQSTLLTEIYNECGIPTSYLDYIKAHDTVLKLVILRKSILFTMFRVRIEKLY